MNVFKNNEEQRLRAGWRILLQLFTMIIIVAPLFFPFYLLLPESLPLTSIAPLFVGAIASVWIAAKYIDNRPFTDYGININKLWIQEYIVGIIFGALAIGAVFLIEWQLGWISIAHFGWNTPTEYPFLLEFLAFLVAMLMVGFHEELFSRGYQILNIAEGLQYPQIDRRLAIGIAIFITSAVFGVLHFNNPNASLLSTANIMIAGFVLATPYILTGRLGLSAGLHFSWNFFMGGIFGFPVSGHQFGVSILQVTQNGPELWTGGSFGPEAGILVLIGMAIMVGGVCVYLKVRGKELSIAPKFTRAYQVAGKSDEQAP